MTDGARRHGVGGIGERRWGPWGLAMGEVTVLRLGHRVAHDRRISTHVCLTARAYGADRIVFPEAAEEVRSTLEDVRERFGGTFTVEQEPSWRPLIRDHDGPSLHLTMYGQRHDEALAEIDTDADLLVIVGAEKVPADVYELASHNVAVGNQPHSEVAALGTVLHEICGPEALYEDREGAQIRIRPSREGKQVDRVEPEG